MFRTSCAATAGCIDFLGNLQVDILSKSVTESQQGHAKPAISSDSTQTQPGRDVLVFGHVVRCVSRSKQGLFRAAICTFVVLWIHEGPKPLLHLVAHLDR